MSTERLRRLSMRCSGVRRRNRTQGQSRQVTAYLNGRRDKRLVATRARTRSTRSPVVVAEAMALVVAEAMVAVVAGAVVGSRLRRAVRGSRSESAKRRALASLDSARGVASRPRRADQRESAIDAVVPPLGSTRLCRLGRSETSTIESRSPAAALRSRAHRGSTSCLRSEWLRRPLTEEAGVNAQPIRHTISEVPSSRYARRRRVMGHGVLTHPLRAFEQLGRHHRRSTSMTTAAHGL